MPVRSTSTSLARPAALAAAVLGAALVLAHVTAPPPASYADAGAAAAHDPTGSSGMLEASDAAVRDADPGPAADADLVLARSAAPLAHPRSVAAMPTALLSTTGAVRRSTTATAKPAAPTAASALSARPLLGLGATGPAVTFVQHALHVSATGYYGPLTQAAVRAFQAQHAIPAVGTVGPLTWRALLTAAGGASAAVPPRRAPAPRAAAAPAPRASAPRPSPHASTPSYDGRICPAPGAAFGQGWGAPRAGHLHQGQDLVGARGSAILAVEDGVVIREGVQSNGALRIVLQGASGAKFFYGHMSKDLVHTGARVHRGQVIGLMGDTGSPGAVHLHFEYWPSGRESAAVDPAALLHHLCG
jgi:hypothetical protein